MRKPTHIVLRSNKSNMSITYKQKLFNVIQFVPGVDNTMFVSRQCLLLCDSDGK